MENIRLFELKLKEIWERTEWLQYEVSESGFIALFPIEFKDDVPLRPDFPEDLDLDRDTRLAVLVAFREAFS
ncbi:hypothetical protein LLH06_20090 [Mucilaginibacter daejeonensis]|uniref:hypothetical protein n=1 Tax=Mucilaginibacter daejeonensis TaxID=398049 RepID=UPI001D175340|nr:hypothetical protein [Mucilaginibacter daejeonensis]UEG53240.1 hypothetical protein LLH06_20090 [Mucilaginibacter daejeonensis]